MQLVKKQIDLLETKFLTLTKVAYVANKGVVRKKNEFIAFFKPDIEKQLLLRFLTKIFVKR